MTEPPDDAGESPAGATGDSDDTTQADQGLVGGSGTGAEEATAAPQATDLPDDPEQP